MSSSDDDVASVADDNASSIADGKKQAKKHKRDAHSTPQKRASQFLGVPDAVMPGNIFKFLQGSWKSVVKQCGVEFAMYL